jgi:hypothetical protein
MAQASCILILLVSFTLRQDVLLFHFPHLCDWRSRCPAVGKRYCVRIALKMKYHAHLIQSDLLTPEASFNPTRSSLAVYQRVEYHRKRQYAQ